MLWGRGSERSQENYKKGLKREDLPHSNKTIAKKLQKSENSASENEDNSKYRKEKAKNKREQSITKSPKVISKGKIDQRKDPASLQTKSKKDSEIVSTNFDYLKFIQKIRKEDERLQKKILKKTRKVSCFAAAKYLKCYQAYLIISEIVLYL